jgi:hypothetical protein
MTTPAASPDTMTFTGSTLVDITSDGTYWYVANTADEIFRGTNTTIGAAWVDLTAQGTVTRVEWCSDRLAVVYTNGSGQSVVSTLGPSGTEEVAGGRFKYTGATVAAITSGDGYIWYAVNRTDRSVVFAWKLGSTDAPFVAVDLPVGEAVTELFFYLGNVMIRVDRGTGGTIYRSVPSDGTLTPERVVELDGAQTVAGGFTGVDRFVLFGWEDMSVDGRSGVGAIDLSTGGWCRWLQAAAAGDNGSVGSLYNWDGLAGFVVNGSGVMHTSTSLSTSGFITSSVMDLASSLTKVIDSISISTDPLGSGAGVEVLVSTDSGTSFTEFGTVNTPGVRAGSWPINRQAATVAVRLNLTATSVSPVVTMMQVKLHPLSLVDMVVELPISCADRQVGLNGLEIQNSVGGLQRARELESLVGTRVVFQDVDYPSTGEVQVWEMVAAEYTSVGVFERQTGARQEAQAVCVCTLRKAR